MRTLGFLRHHQPTGVFIIDTVTPSRPPVKRVPKAPGPPRRALNGVLLLDKPLGMSSNDALGRAKWILKAKKGGHTGTLDPLASGLLPLCFGEATKFSNDALDASKSYDALVVLGSTTSTGDREGAILQTREIATDVAAIHRALEKFRGDILQIPPMYSALKRDGKPLYDYARAGIVLERGARPVTIEELSWLDEAQWHASENCTRVCPQLPQRVHIWGSRSAGTGAVLKYSEDPEHRTTPKMGPLGQLRAHPTLNLRVRCSKGTYIRVLAEDIGEALGCGAHLGGLRRTQVGSFFLESAVTLDALQEAPDPEAFLLPIDALLPSLPILKLEAHQAERFLQGQRLRLALAEQSGFALSTQRCRVYGEPAMQFLGVGHYIEGLLTPQRVVAIH